MKKIILLVAILITAGLTSSPAQDTWVQKSDFGYNAPNVPEPNTRSGAVGFSIGDKGYMGTGYTAGAHNDFWEYAPDANTWTQKSDFGGSARSEAVGFCIGSKGYIGTGYDITGTYKNDFWEYDPDANTWTQKSDFGGSARSEAVGFSINNKGYIGTGHTTNGIRKDFWEYDPTIDIWTEKADFGGSARSGAVGFSIGSKGYIGTGYGNNYKQDFWEYNSDDNTWTQKSDFVDARTDAIGFSIGSKGYIGSGVEDAGYDTKGYNNDLWAYDPDANTWIQKASCGGARAGATGFSIGSKGYIGTGYWNSDFGQAPVNYRDFWSYDPDANTWTQKADFGGTARSGAVGFSIGNKGYIGTGSEYTWGNKKDFWEYDSDANTWTQKADFGGSARSAAVGFNIGSKGYIGTGRNCCSYYRDFWEYDPAANTWTKKADFGGSARVGATGFSIGNKGYIGTGNDGSNFKNDFWEYDPGLNTWTPKANFGGTVRSSATGFSIGSKGYIGTGSNTKDFWEYYPAANTWTKKADFGGSARSGATGFSIGTKGYIGTGGYSDFWEYDPAINNWMKKADFEGSIRSGATGISIGSKGYIGTGSETKDFWEYSPGCPDLTVYADADGDSYGDISNSYLALDCVVPNGYVSDSTDCDDNDAGILGSVTYYFDGDGDGYGDPNAYVIECSQPLGYVTNNTECNDNTASINPGAAELLNGIDDNCNGKVDEGFCDVPLGTFAENVTGTSAKLKWNLVAGAEGYKIRYKVSGTGAWILKYSTGKSQILNNLSSNTNYTWEIKTYCTIAPGSSSDWSAKQEFTTGSLRMDDESVQQVSFQIYPNPAEDHATIQFTLSQSSHVCIKVYDVSGKEIEIVMDGDMEQGEHSLQLSTNHFSKGVYLVKMISDLGIVQGTPYGENQKLIVQ